MSRPIDADGTIRYSTGRPGRENAPAVADPPAKPMIPGSRTVARAATVNLRAQRPRNLPTKVITAVHPSFGYRERLHPVLPAPHHPSGPKSLKLCDVSKTCEQDRENPGSRSVAYS